MNAPSRTGDDNRWRRRGARVVDLVRRARVLLLLPLVPALAWASLARMAMFSALPGGGYLATLLLVLAVTHAMLMGGRVAAIANGADVRVWAVTRAEVLEILPLAVMTLALSAGWAHLLASPLPDAAATLSALTTVLSIPDMLLHDNPTPAVIGLQTLAQLLWSLSTAGWSLAAATGLVFAGQSIRSGAGAAEAVSWLLLGCAAFCVGVTPGATAADVWVIAIASTFGAAIVLVMPFIRAVALDEWRGCFANQPRGFRSTNGTLIDHVDR